MTGDIITTNPARRRQDLPPDTTNMALDKPNVVFLSVDAVRFDHTSLGGYERPTTPTLARLSEDAIICKNTFSLGPFTQSACIQMLTSSRPFSYGGFDHGAWGRPKTVFHQFHDAGYETTAISTLHWVNRFMGYGDGLDEECQLFILNSLVGVCVGNIRNSLSLFHEEEISEGEMLRVVEPILTKFFEDTAEYCRLRTQDAGPYRAAFPNSLLVNNRYDYQRVLKVLERHRRAFQRNPTAYVRERLEIIPETHEWIAADWKYCREPGKLMGEAAFQASNWLLARFNPELARNRKHRFKSYVDAYEVADKVISKLQTHDGKRPFFIWAHFMDTHLPYVSGRGTKWYRETPDILEALGHPRDIAPTGSRDARPETPEQWTAYGALYDAAIHTVDSQIGRIVDALEELGLHKDTVVAVCGDHGEEFGEHGSFSHLFTFYDHNVRVPLLFHRPGFGRRTINGLATLMDIAPTLANLTGIDPNPDWEGEALIAPLVENRDHVLMETFFGGNCLFAHRPVYFGVRTPTHKYIWKDRRDERDLYSPERPELFDLELDPGEQNNIYEPDHPLVPGLNAIIARRMAGIPEIPRQRIVAAFGADVLEKCMDKGKTGSRMAGS